MKISHAARIACAGLAACITARTADNDLDYYGLHFENDVFASTDQYYTHATRFDRIFAAEDNPAWLEWFASRLPDAGNRSTVVGLYLSQYIYTPPDITVADPPLDQRPYAGWLHLGLQGSAIRDDMGMADTVAISVGVIGPSSGSETAQREIHKIINSADPKGWDTQLPDEPALDLMLERRWRFCTEPGSLLEAQALPYFGGNLGTVFNQARVGATLRAGVNIPNDFGSTVLRPAGRRPGAAPRPWGGFNLFTTVEGRLVGYNTLVEGSLFQDSRGVDAEPWVADLALGAQFTAFRSLVVTYAYVVRTEEFEAQESNQEFGSLSIGCAF